MTMSHRSYEEMSRFATFEERFNYLALNGVVGGTTFGFERWMNQEFYRSREWKHIRNDVIARDEGRDLGVDGYDIHSRIIIHHIIPITPQDLENGNPLVLDLNNLITTTHDTHNAIHYGDATLLPQPLVERRPGDTLPWA